MNSAVSDAFGAVPPHDADDVPQHTLKILVAGGFGVGKTTFVGAVSEVRPLRTEETLTDASTGVDDLSGVEGKTTTTVAMDFGRLTFSGGVRLYLFGTPGQERFWFMWDQIAYGAVGAIVLVDTRRLTTSFASIDFFEQREIPFVVAANCFDGARRYTEEEIRGALDVDPDVPVMLCDVRRPETTKHALVTLVEHALRSSAPR
ncbi:GTP-binding protein [Actinomadura rubrisoli]|uniref:ATP-binding protein n=1 Tax=Actinomadura rubrisoli TaxID=2530368 RepID=A0A4R5C4F8_9ACTN|nr:ATP/GTP-binding protein [Actinomadura rubrisoli]TDD93316.1 ATP-binding protein [Actinomadura rubrisoli]